MKTQDEYNIHPRSTRRQATFKDNLKGPGKMSRQPSDCDGDLSDTPIPDIVYHASQQDGLSEIKPRKSTHQVPWVYATTEIALAALFLNHDGGDLSCATGLSNGKIYIFERWDGAFDHRYKGRYGSIYLLPGEHFRRGRTSFTGEVVSEVTVPVLREIQVPEIKTYLFELELNGKLQVYLHDNRPGWIPEDDQDLVDRVVAWSQRPGDRTLDYVKKYHPHLITRIQDQVGVEAGGSDG